MVRPRPPHEAQRLIGKGKVILNEFLEFSGLVRRRSGKFGLGGVLFPMRLDVFFPGQNEPLLRGRRRGTQTRPYGRLQAYPGPGLHTRHTRCRRDSGRCLIGKRQD